MTTDPHAANAAIQRRYRERQLAQNADAYRKRRCEIAEKSRQRNLRKYAARRRVYVAVRAGKLVRPNSCQWCGKECTPEASHDDYDRPLEVEWLCRQCHGEKDRGTMTNPTLRGADCCYCGKPTKIGSAKAVKGRGTYIGWRHPDCFKPTNLEIWALKCAEADEFVQILRSGDRSSLHPALRW